MTRNNRRMWTLLLFLLTTTNAQDVTDDTTTPTTTSTTTTTKGSTETGVTAVTCMSYIYVTWSYFIMQVGMGLQPRGYTNLLYYVYSFIPTDCGGYDTSDNPISPENLLRILMYTGIQNQNPFQPHQNQYQGYQNPYQISNQNNYQNPYQISNQNNYQNPYQPNQQQYSDTNMLASFLKTEENKKMLTRQRGRLNSKPKTKNRDISGMKSAFKNGKNALKGDKSLFSLVKNVKFPFNSKGKFRVDKKKLIKARKNLKKPFPCKKLARTAKERKQVCKKLKLQNQQAQRKKKLRLLKKKKNQKKSKGKYKKNLKMKFPCKKLAGSAKERKQACKKLKLRNQVQSKLKVFASWMNKNNYNHLKLGG